MSTRFILLFTQWLFFIVGIFYAFFNKEQLQYEYKEDTKNVNDRWKLGPPGEMRAFINTPIYYGKLHYKSAIFFFFAFIMPLTILIAGTIKRFLFYEDWAVIIIDIFTLILIIKIKNFIFL